MIRGKNQFEDWLLLLQFHNDTLPERNTFAMSVWYISARIFPNYFLLKMIWGNKYILLGETTLSWTIFIVTGQKAIVENY